MLPPAIDVEFYADKESNPPTRDEIKQKLMPLLNRLEVYYGKKPIIYVTKSSYEAYIKGDYKEYPLSVRDIIKPPTMVQKERTWTFWQYCNRGRLKGYEGEEYIDKNIFKGDWEKFCNVRQDSYRFTNNKIY